MAEVSIGPSVSEHRFQESEWDDNAGFSMTVMDERSVDEELMTVSVDNETSALRIATDEQSADEELLTISDDNETVYSMDG